MAAARDAARRATGIELFGDWLRTLEGRPVDETAGPDFSNAEVGRQ